MSVGIDTQLDALFDVDAPRMTATETAQRFGVTRGAVLHAIRTGRLPAQRVGNGQRVTVWLVRPRDALLIWGHRLHAATDR
ncbi:hypothetical protein MMAG44476_20069 [Mycolicibacterium mageritense DSM 44476 = CIP 104973]|uniref:DNA-binding protein n=1 Tax=Mycolicibacterium mageritense TaxID=53462 RepID=A0ABM7HZE9_MYCME|nr:hypothetical protein MMAGJ_52430 [Mycolicibacterium mageritense]CDO24082.1 hypothetical protein BN978_04574 [Mycolicibacterium mageritense DSM 44476 = CIP 104973]SLH66515.1 Uncharacterised protein [Mycobacteroides abscessus subsp. abscessus]